MDSERIAKMKSMIDVAHAHGYRGWSWSGNACFGYGDNHDDVCLLYINGDWEHGINGVRGHFVSGNGATDLAAELSGRKRVVS